MTEPYDVIKELGECPECGCKKWIGLTDKEINEINANFLYFESKARAIEAKLKEKNT